jgi:predicted DNA-binding protein YlxM (UPF0122 family)
MEKFVYYNELYLIYKDLLKDNARDIFDLYYGENLSMQEIADIKNISKSRVGIIIKNSEKQLENYEKVLNIYKNKSILMDIINLDNIDTIKERINLIIKGE